MVSVNFYGRIKNRLSKKNEELLQQFLPKFLFSNTDFTQKTFFNKLSNYTAIALEIGFGYGDFLYQTAKNNSNILYLGAEVYANGVAALLAKLKENPLDNLRIYNSNVYNLFPSFPDSFLSCIYILFPDPWPKKKHNKRRMLSKDNLLTFSRILKNGGEIRFVTDIEDYCSWTLDLIEHNNNFVLGEDVKKDIYKKPDDLFTTKYETKALGKKHKIFYVTAINNK